MGGPETVESEPQQLPLGQMEHDYGQNSKDTAASGGTNEAAGKRNFWVQKGDLVVRWC